MSDSTVPETNKKRKLIVFYRLPETGRVKKRLAVRVGAEAALELYWAMLEDLERNLESLGDIVLPMADSTASPGPEAPDTTAELQVSPAGGICRTYARTEAFAGKGVLIQQGSGLGERMENAFHAVFREPEPAETAVLIGSDIPHIRPETILSAFDLLAKRDAVLGPAADGGYYLIGFRADVFSRLQRAASPGIFRNVPWGTADVFSLTMSRARGLGLSVGKVSRMEDLDTCEDLLRVLNGPEAERLPCLQAKASELDIRRAL